VLEDILARLLDPRFGIITELAETPHEPGMPQLFHYFARGTNTAALGAEGGFDLGGGASLDRDRAMAKAVGEVVERYCAAFFRRADLPLVSAAEATFAHVDPSSFALNRPDQYAAGSTEFVPFTDELPVRWTQAIDCTTTETSYVPAAAVYLPYVYRETEEPFMQPISTGLACGEDFDKALLSAVCEAIERDAFTIFWQAKLPPPRIPRASLDAENRELLDRFERARFDIALLNITTDLSVPCAMAVACHDDPSQPALTVAAASHPVADVAVRKCLEELEHTRFYARRVKATVAPIDPNRVDEIYEQEQHIRFWAELPNRHRAGWLFESNSERPLSAAVRRSDDATAMLRSVRESLERARLRMLCVDVTTPEIRALGLHVVRAIVPGLHPLVIGHRRRALGGHRLYDVPARLGYDTPEFPLDDPTNPHPFP
jgi:ribosomal protein S12 methylthiotransferase accessory factor